MSESKHTPGPWLLGESMTGFVYALRKRGDVNRMYLQVRPGYTDADKRTSEVETYANTCLIAAAPDLLAACKAVLEAIVTDGDFCCICLSEINNHQSGCAALSVQAAIAKAEAE